MNKYNGHKWKTFILSLGWGWVSFYAPSAKALEIDWSGQFWSEFNFVHNYSMDSSGAGVGFDNARFSAQGYYIPSAGNHDASFQSLFLRLNPKVIVNDNVLLKSEWWVGDPIFGMFGSSLPYGADQTQHYSTFSRGSLISAQRFWGEFISDFGTFQVGRVPLQWGLGVVWNSGDALWSRYMSTGDAVRWIAKFGSFMFAPSVIVPSIGNTVGGSCAVANQTCTYGQNGGGGLVDYSLILKYESPEEDIEGGINLIKRLGGSSQDVNSNLVANGRSSRNLLTYDFYVKKKFHQFSIGAEVPLGSGTLAGATYKGIGVAGELSWKASEEFNLLMKLGYASGQASANADQTLGSFDSFYFHPNYHLGMIMFNYQLANFYKPQTQNSRAAGGMPQSALGSPYDNPIVNAQYVALATQFKASEQWSIRPTFVYAIAPQVAKAGQAFYNYWTRQVTATNTATRDQSKSLGFEFDLGVTFQWDDHFMITWDNGLYIPGKFYAFSGTPVENATSTVFASSLRLGVSF